MRVTEQEFARLQSRTGTPLREIAEIAIANAQKAQNEVSAADAGQPKRKRRIGVSGVVKPPTEHQEQAALFDWAAEHADKRLEMLFAIPNGAGVNHQHSRNGKRFSLEGAKLKREGMKQGVPDVFLACPSKVNHVWKNGLFIEMKRAKKSLSRVTPEQLQWKAALEAMGYCVAVCYGADEAKAAIENYLGVTA